MISVTRLFFGSNFVTKSDYASWDIINPQIFASIMNFYSSRGSLFLDSETAATKETAIREVTTYAAQIKRCGEMARKLHFFNEQMLNAGVSPSSKYVTETNIVLDAIEVLHLLPKNTLFF